MKWIEANDKQRTAVKEAEAIVTSITGREIEGSSSEYDEEDFNDEVLLMRARKPVY